MDVKTTSPVLPHGLAPEPGWASTFPADEERALAEAFVARHGAAYHYIPLERVPVSRFDARLLPDNPNPDCFVRMGDAWVNKNPDPSRYALQGEYYVRLPANAGASSDAAKAINGPVPTAKLSDLEQFALAEAFVARFIAAGKAQGLLCVPVVEFDISAVAKNPAPTLFTLSPDRSRWVNKNPDPKAFVREGDYYIRKELRHASCELVQKGWLSTHSEALETAVGKASGMTKRLAEFRQGPAALRLDSVGERLGRLACAFSVRDGLTLIKEGIREDDERKKLEGIKELCIGASVAVPPLAPVGLLLWVFLSQWDFRRAHDEASFEGELTALGYTGATAGWLVPHLTDNAVGEAFGMASGLTGCALLIGKDISNLIESYGEQDKAKRATSLAKVVFEIGIALAFAGCGGASAVVTSLALGPYLAYNLVGGFREGVDKNLDAIEKGVVDPIAPPIAEVLVPAAKRYLELREKLARPVEREVFRWLVDEPAAKIAAMLEPVNQTMDAIGATEAAEELADSLADDVLEPIDQNFMRLDKWLTALFARISAHLGRGSAPEPQQKDPPAAH